MWLRGEEDRQLSGVNTLEATLASKANGVYDMRGYGDGHSFSGGYTDAYGNLMAGEEGRVAPANTTFQGLDTGDQRSTPASAVAGAAGRTCRNGDQSETHF